MVACGAPTSLTAQTDPASSRRPVAPARASLAWPSGGEPTPALRADPVAGRVATRGPTASPGAGEGAPGAERVALYSLVLPGAGQLALGQRRGWAYVAAEAVAWYLHVDRRAEGHDLRDAYRALAWETARDMRGPAVVDDFEYYERLLHWPASGAFDADPEAPGVQPETDPATFNGSIWRRAEEIFLGADPDDVPVGDPRRQEAVAYYADRAYAADLLWDWSGSPDARERFGDLLKGSDEMLREATIMIGLILTNHVLSAADAFVSARLRDATHGRVDGGLALSFREMRHAPPLRPGGVLARTGGSVSLHMEVIHP